MDSNETVSNKEDEVIEKLLPCPFCGSKDLQVSNYGENIVCRTCAAEGPWKHEASKEELIKKWNNRVAAPKPELGSMYR